MAETFHQLGTHATAANNFTLRSNGDGSLSLGKGTAASFTELMKINADGTISVASLASALAAVTQSIYDNTTKIATTAYVDRMPPIRAVAVFDNAGTKLSGSFNVGTVSDNGPGDFTVNFTTALPSGNYAIFGTSGLNTTSLRTMVQPYNLSAPAPGSCRVQFVSADGVLADGVFHHVLFIGG